MPGPGCHSTVPVRRAGSVWTHVTVQPAPPRTGPGPGRLALLGRSSRREPPPHAHPLGGGRQDLANHKHEHDRRTRVSQRTAEANKTVECWGPGWRRSAGGQEGLPGGGGIYATTGRSGHWCWGSRVFFPQSIENTRTLESPAALCPWSGGPDGGRRLVTCWVMRPSLPLGSPGHLGPCVPWDPEASPLLRCHPGTAWEVMPTQVGG